MNVKKWQTLQTSIERGKLENEQKALELSTKLKLQVNLPLIGRRLLSRFFPAKKVKF